MIDSKRTTNIAEAIYEYIYDVGEGKLNLAEIVGILELVKIDLVNDAIEVD